MRNLLLIALALPLAACSPADIIEGKPSPFQLHQERMALVEVQAPAVSVETIVADIDPVIDVEVVPVVVVEPPPPPEPEPVCVPVFRVVVCP